LAYDKVLAKYLKHDVLVGKVKRELYKDYASLEQQGHLARHAAEGERDQKKRTMKTRNHQPAFNRGVVNEDAFYKHLAYSGMLEKQRREAPKGALDQIESYAGFHEFEHFYQDELLADAKRPPRPIEAELYKPKHRPATEGSSDAVATGFLDTAGRREQFLADLDRYGEKKLEHLERTELFYVMEQFFESSRQSPATPEGDPQLHQA